MKAKCPYCGKVNNIDLSDINVEDDKSFLHECSNANCTKYFYVTLHIDVTCSVKPCKCQGEAHELELTPVYPRAFAMMRCKYCDFERPLTEEERELYKIPSVKEYFETIKNYE